MIHFQMENGFFNFRVAGIFCVNGQVLLHHSEKGYYAFPGGRVEPFEDTKAALIREFNEEMGQPVRVGRLLAVHENFFKKGETPWHELGFYYLAEPENSIKVPTSGTFAGSERKIDGSPLLEFVWQDISELDILNLRPAFLRPYVENPPAHTLHVVEHGF